jgi:hypothetical protein
VRTCGCLGWWLVVRGWWELVPCCTPLWPGPWWCLCCFLHPCCWACGQCCAWQGPGLQVSPCRVGAGCLLVAFCGAWLVVCGARLVYLLGSQNYWAGLHCVLWVWSTQGVLLHFPWCCAAEVRTRASCCDDCCSSALFVATVDAVVFAARPLCLPGLLHPPRLSGVPPHRSQFGARWGHA